MKLSASFLGLAAASGVACAGNCTSKTTTTITQTFFNPINGTVSVATGTDMMSVYNGSTSIITVTGAMTNPFVASTTTFTEAISYSYVTVPGTTCTVGKGCFLTGHGPVVHNTTINATNVGASLTNLPATLSADNGTIITTMTFTNSTNVPDMASSPIPVDSSKVSISTTITSFLTQVTTKVVTAPAIVETETASSAQAATVTVTVATTGTVTSTAIPIFTITVSPVPLSAVSASQESRDGPIVTPVDATTTLSTEQSTVTVIVAGSSCMASNASTAAMISPSSVSSLLSLSTPVAATGTAGIAVFSSSGSRANTPRVFMWLAALSKLVGASFSPLMMMMNNGTSSHVSANHSVGVISIVTVTAGNSSSTVSSPVHVAVTPSVPPANVTTVTAVLVLNSTVTEISVNVSTSTKTSLYNVYETDRYTSTVTDVVTMTGLSSGTQVSVQPWFSNVAGIVHEEKDFQRVMVYGVFFLGLAVVMACFF